MLSTAISSSPPLISSSASSSFRPSSVSSSAKRPSLSLDAKEPTDNNKRPRFSLSRSVSSPSPPSSSAASPPAPGLPQQPLPTNHSAQSPPKDVGVHGAQAVPHNVTGGHLPPMMAATTRSTTAATSKSGSSWPDVCSSAAVAASAYPSPSLSLSSTITVQTSLSDDSLENKAWPLPLPTIAVQSPAGTPSVGLLVAGTATIPAAANTTATDTGSDAGAAPKRRRTGKSPQKHSPPGPRPPGHIPHHRKLHANAISKELGRLGPGVGDTPRSEGRKLRSAEAARYKSELSTYFPDYDEVIGNKPKQQQDLDYDTPVVLAATIPSGDSSNFGVRAGSSDVAGGFCQSMSVDFSSIELAYIKAAVEGNPLTTESFVPVHRRTARFERSIRNSEAGRAQHNRDHIARLLEDLQGHDWLRTLGVSGITGSQRAKYEPARRHFIAGCRSILEKFRLWAVEERRRKLAKEGANRRLRAVAAGEVVEDSDVDGSRPRSRARSTAQRVTKARASRVEISRPKPRPTPIPSAGRILLKKAPVASKTSTSCQTRRRRASTTTVTPDLAPTSTAFFAPPPAPAAPEPMPIFTSFFKSRHERDVALGRLGSAHETTVSRGTVLALAFGVPLPDMPEREFSLGERILDRETVRARERDRRRARRAAERP